jgi:hypothetical protein
LGLVRVGRESNAELEDIRGAYANAVEAVGDVDLDKLDGTVGWVRQHDVAKQARQGVAELHGVTGSNGDRIVVEVEERVIDYGTGPAIVLGDATHGANAKIGEVFDGVVRKDEPLGLVDHGGELSAEKVDMFIGGTVRTSVDGVGTLRWGPRCGTENDGRTAMFVLTEKPAGGVSKRVKGSKVATALAHSNKGLPTQFIKQF